MLTLEIPYAMKREELIRQCRYYKGEEENPYEKELTDHEIDKSMLPPPECMKTEYKGLTEQELKELSYKRLVWGYEKTWVRFNLDQEHSRYLDEMVDDFMACGLEDLNNADNTPISLKALLFNRYAHWSGGYGSDKEGFEAWYLSVR